MLSRDTEEALAGYLHEIVDHVDDGMAPTDAVYKVAAAKDLPSGHVRVLCQAYNTGRTLGQMKTAASPEEKAAEFPLADPDAVLARLYPETIKSAGQVHRETAVSPDYAAQPGQWLQRKHQAELLADYAPGLAPREKQAEAPRVPEPYTDNARWLAKRAALTRQYEECRREVDMAGMHALEKLGELVTYFKRAGSLPYPAVRRNCEIVHGSSVSALFDEVAQRWPAVTKQAGESLGFHPEQQPYNLVAECLAAGQRYKQASDAFERAELPPPILRTPNRADSTICPEWKVADSPNPTQAEAKTASAYLNLDEPEKQAGMGSGMALGMIGRDLMNQASGKVFPDEDKLVASMKSQLESPEHEAELRGIQTQALLHDLVHQDPVLKSYDPQDLVESYNYLAQLAPRAAGSRPLMQSLLRRHMAQGQIEPHEISQLVDIDSQLHERDATHPAPTQPMGYPGK